ncbi:hypothetical protein CEV32_3805 [Brucella rhizosphaerae]|uniref:Uncharacterized protein n=1 Tax=Brucella rhizosphaerae TaxID=571254 RepID=A0A256FSE5_9HYPH|nr:hypothetical protein CEV32_3805 [Brucella rhizosphaerae]
MVGSGIETGAALAPNENIAIAAASEITESFISFSIHESLAILDTIVEERGTASSRSVFNMPISLMF